MDFYHIYADESRIHGRFLLFGALFVPRGQVENDFQAAISAFRSEQGLNAEMKWGKVSRYKLDAYRGFVDIFFAHPAVEYRCLAVDTHRIDYRRFHEGDHEVAFYNFYCLMLSRNLDPGFRYLVYTDERNNREKNRLSDLKANINDYWAGRGIADDIVRNIEPRISKECDQLQVVDILLGAVGYDIEEYNTSEPRVALVNHIAHQVGAPQLKEHRGRGTRFNIWVFDFDRAEKNVESRPDP